MLDFLKTAQWALIRRIILVIIVIVVAFRTYGGGLTSLFSGPDPQRDIVVTKTEFRTDISTEKPVWIIGFRNSSRKFTYDTIELQSNYFDKDGKFLSKDTLVVSQRLDPLQEKTIASPDPKQRENATQGSLTVIAARQVQ
jgi:hypothetical protein